MPVQKSNKGMLKARFGEIRLGQQFVADYFPHRYVKINESQGEDVSNGTKQFFDADSKVFIDWIPYHKEAK